MVLIRMRLEVGLDSKIGRQRAKLVTSRVEPQDASVLSFALSRGRSPWTAKELIRHSLVLIRAHGSEIATVSLVVIHLRSKIAESESIHTTGPGNGSYLHYGRGA
jgi:hypothetical protein